MAIKTGVKGFKGGKDAIGAPLLVRQRKSERSAAIAMSFIGYGSAAYDAYHSLIKTPSMVF